MDLVMHLVNFTVVLSFGLKMLRYLCKRVIVKKIMSFNQITHKWYTIKFRKLATGLIFFNGRF